MLKIHFVRDFTNPDPQKRKKIKSLQIAIGRRCQVSCWCNKANKCRYGRGGYKFHNALIEFRCWVHRKLHIELPSLVYFCKWDVDLSGTTKCPYKMPRRYTCWDCKQAYGMENCRISWDKRKPCEDIEWPNSHCGSYEPDEFADSWDRKTGERIY